jgi:protocatechuate 3,4-dioxygenase beta subunit
MDRRNFLLTSTAFLVSAQSASAASPLVPTPASTEGPYYPDRMPAETNSDLTRIGSGPGPARGTALDLTGRVLTVSGAVIPGARIEIWQCDADGRYLHSASSGERGIDPGFQGFGRTVADGTGAYGFRTIVPVPYGGRTPHIHARLTAPNGRRLTTQIYLPGHAMNEDDFLFSRLGGPENRRAASLALRTPEATGYRAGTFDFVLR